jgi:hypothetical protein
MKIKDITESSWALVNPSRHHGRAHIISDLLVTKLSPSPFTPELFTLSESRGVFEMNSTDLTN